ncbi:MAG TPA: hypothetical protein VG871_24380 [Vicinamibacterales bacterium]|nr:hypothetical protein [Vicinamibacterales bacterium]
MDERAPLSDDVLDRELQQALGVEPSPEFAARVRMRLATEAIASTWGTRSWAAVAAVAVTAAAAAMVLTIGSGRERPATPAAIATRTLSISGTAAPRIDASASPGPTSRSERRASFAASRADRTPRLELPDVIVPAGQERALRMFAEAAWQQRVQPASGSSPASEEPLEIAPIEPAPVDIEPLPQMAALEGDRP